MTLKKRNFPDDLKTARVTSIFKACDNQDLVNYGRLSILPFFSRILERIMHNRLFGYLTKNDMLYKKQLGFQKGHSTEHAIIELFDQINNSE